MQKYNTGVFSRMISAYQYAKDMRKSGAFTRVAIFGRAYNRNGIAVLLYYVCSYIN